MKGGYNTDIWIISIFIEALLCFDQSGRRKNRQSHIVEIAELFISRLFLIFFLPLEIGFYGKKGHDTHQNLIWNGSDLQKKQISRKQGLSYCL